MNRSTGLKLTMAGPGEEILLNGDFDSNTGSWTTVNCNFVWAATPLNGNGELQFLLTGSGHVYQDITTVVGNVYVLQAHVLPGSSSSTMALQAFPVGNEADYDMKSSGETTALLSGIVMTRYFVASSVSTRIQVVANNEVDFDGGRVFEISCKKAFTGMVDGLVDFKIDIYSTTIPTSPDDVPNGALLCTVDDGSGGALNFQKDLSHVFGEVVKSADDTWSGINSASGDMGWARMYESTDTPANSSTTANRIDFSIGLSGEDVNVTNVTLTSGATTQITSFTYTEKT